MIYLTPDDLPRFGLPDTTTAAEIRGASRIIDNYLSRPEGLVWTPDYAGMPCCMAGLKPTLEFVLPSDIAPAPTVTVALGATVNLQSSIGHVVILDQDSPAKIEAVYISAASAGSVTLKGVTLAHTAGATMRLGLVIMEERDLPAGRNVTQSMKGPLRRIISAYGRYDYGRRSDQRSHIFEEISLLATLSSFGGAPQWIEIDVNQISFSSTSDEIWVPAGNYLAYFNSIQTGYVCGFTQNAIPEAVKSSVAAIIGSKSLFPELSGNIKMVKAGDSAVQRFADSTLDADTRTQLDIYKARMWA